MKRNKKFNKIFRYLPIILGFVLIFMSIFNTYQEKNVFSIISGILLILIPYIYTVSPIVNERYKENNNLTNRLSENTFTDRKNDLQNLLDLLNKCQTIQLTGTDRQCGKSWLAFKLIDYIKHPKDIEFKKYHPLKMQYKNVYYIDMDQKTDAEINAFFETNVVTRKTLIIADHIKKVDYIFSKQEVYEFSLIFITTNSIETKGTVYYISEFERHNVPKLQENIKRNYSNIETLNKWKIDTLYDLTFGNIGKIHFLLEHQEYVGWIKQLARNLQTTYDKALNKIQLELFKGEYSLAQSALNEFKQQYNLELPNNNDLYFKYFIMKSDCEHLLNNYQNALDILNVLKRKELEIYNVDDKIKLLEAHYYKHLWKCDEALDILHTIQSSNISGLTDSLGILVAKYFIDDLKVKTPDLNSLSAFFQTFEMCKYSSLKKSDKDLSKIMRNESIYLYYKKKSTRKKILEPINSVIIKYRNENNRLLANAYFVRAEINRLFKKYKNALLDYNRCLTQTEDDNIKIQVNIMKYYLAIIKNVTIFKADSFLSKEQILKLCKNKNQYGMLLLHRINSIELEDPDKEQIINCFEHRIMTIL